jgi:hypothetical protein
MADRAKAKAPFLVVYDYGAGGVWSIVHARTAAEITAKYPELKVFEPRPAWMDDKEYARIARVRAFDIDAHPSGWLLTLVKERNSN